MHILLLFGVMSYTDMPTYTGDSFKWNLTYGGTHTDNRCILRNSGLNQRQTCIVAAFRIVLNTTRLKIPISGRFLTISVC